MANGTPDAHLAALAQRVTGIEGQISAMVTHNDHQFSALSSQIKSLSDAMAAKSQTPWGTLISAMGVLIVVIAYGGNLALAPVIQRIGTAETSIDAIRFGIVPRGEHERVWLNADHDRDNLQRQVDELKTAIGGIYGVRDVIADLKENQDELRKEISRIPMREQ